MASKKVFKFLSVARPADPGKFWADGITGQASAESAAQNAFVRTVQGFLFFAPTDADYAALSTANTDNARSIITNRSNYDKAGAGCALLGADAASYALAEIVKIEGNKRANILGAFGWLLWQVPMAQKKAAKGMLSAAQVKEFIDKACERQALKAAETAQARKDKDADKKAGAVKTTTPDADAAPADKAPRTYRGWADMVKNARAYGESLKGKKVPELLAALKVVEDMILAELPKAETK